jgi:uncharacterized protein YbjT (DUF2867 family)
MSTPQILVLRATGAQGVGVLKNLQRHGIKARAYVSDASSTRAQALSQYGAEAHEGTLRDRQALEKALSGCTGLFLNQMPSFTDDTETREARLILELALKAGIKHVVHSTSLGVPRKASFEQSITNAAVVGNADVEVLVKASEIRHWTILRGGYFDTNFLGFASQFMFPELAKEKKFVCSYKPDTLLPLVDPYDIGAFAVAAFIEPERFHQQVIPVVAEKRTVEQVVRDLSAAAGRDIQAIYRTDAETEELGKTNPIVAAAKWMFNLHEEADIEGIKQWGVSMTTFPEFLQNERQAVVTTFGLA